MKRIKVGIALITMSGLLLGTSSIALAKTTPVHHPKVSQISTKLTHSSTKSTISKKSVSKTVKAKKSVKTTKSSKTKPKTKQSTVHA